jgi:hypothetical protein
MPFREKIAWIALLGILAAGAVYFGLLWRHGGRPDHGYFVGLFLAIVTVQTICTIIASIVVSIMSRADAGAPRDERDKRIASGAAGQTYYLLLIGIILAGVTIHLGNTLFGILNTILAVVMLAEALRYGSIIAAYRRGWHG